MSASGRRIAIPMDGSANSKKALKWYFEELMKKNDFVIFIHVYEQALAPTTIVPGSVLQLPVCSWSDAYQKRLSFKFEFLSV